MMPLRTMFSLEVHEKVDALAEEVDRVEGYIEQALFYARSESLDRDYVVRNVSLQSIVSSALKRNARAMISARVAPFAAALSLRCLPTKNGLSSSWGSSFKTV